MNEPREPEQEPALPDEEEENNPAPVVSGAADSERTMVNEQLSQSTSSYDTSNNNNNNNSTTIMSRSDKETVVHIMEQDQLDRQRKIEEQERSVQYRQAVTAIAQDDKLEAKAAAARPSSSSSSNSRGGGGSSSSMLPANMHAPANAGLLGNRNNTTTSSMHAESSDIFSTTQESFVGPDEGGDEESGDIIRNNTTAPFSGFHTDQDDDKPPSEDNDGEILVHAELVEEEHENRPIEEQTPMKDPELLVDAEMLETSPEMVKRRRMIRTLSITTCSVIVVAIIVVISVVLTQNDGGTSVSQLQIVASSAPSMSIAPSASPSSSPSKTPSTSPSQAPTRLVWESMQSLNDLEPIISLEGATPFGGQRFGTNMQFSDISGTPLANRTGRDILAAIQFAEETSSVVNGALENWLLGVSIYLCGGEQFSQGGNTREFCELANIVTLPVQEMDLSETFLLIVSKTNDFSIHDLSDIDQQPDFVVPQVGSGFLQNTPRAISINSNGTGFIHVSDFRKELLTVDLVPPPTALPPSFYSPTVPFPFSSPSALPPSFNRAPSVQSPTTTAFPPTTVLPPSIIFSPTVLPPIIATTPTALLSPTAPAPVQPPSVFSPIPLEALSPPLELSNGAGVFQTLSISGLDLFLKELFWTVAMTDDTIVTIHAVENPLFVPEICVANAVCLDFGSYKIYHTNIAFENTLPPLHVSDASTSPFSRKGFSINRDATIVAVSSAQVDYNGTNIILPTEVEFEVRVFQMVNSSHWELMGSPIPSPAPSTGDYFGHSLALNADGTILIVGANEDRENGRSSGKVYTFSWNGSAWQPLGDPLPGTAGASFGQSVALTDDASVLMIGAPGQDINGADSGEVTVYQIAGV